jgi:hypothetical protein
VVTALRDLGIGSLRKAIQAMGDAGATRRPQPACTAGPTHGQEANVMIVEGVTGCSTEPRTVTVETKIRDLPPLDARRGASCVRG